jgi:hypothetical protein
MRLKNSVLWDITPCSPLKVNRSFGTTCRLHLQCRRISQARNQHEAGSKHSLKSTGCQFQAGFFFGYSSNLAMEATCCSETSVYFQWTHGVLSQKIQHSITTSVRTPNLIEVKFIIKSGEDPILKMFLYYYSIRKLLHTV